MYVYIYINQLNVDNLAGGFKYSLFSPLVGELIQFHEHIFQMGWNHQLVTIQQKITTPLKINDWNL